MSLAYTDEAVIFDTMTDAEDTLGGRIIHARETAGLSTAQLARRLGVKTATLQGWESDRSEPRSNRLLMLASVLNVSVTWLLAGSGEGPSVEIAAPTAEDMKSMLRQLREQSLAITEEIDNVARLLR